MHAAIPPRACFALIHLFMVSSPELLKSDDLLDQIIESDALVSFDKG
jgi:hypothetical protein